MVGTPDSAALPSGIITALLRSMRAARTLLLGAALATFGALSGAAAVPGLAADPCTYASVNPIPCENTQPGTPQSAWDVNAAGDPSIQGFATDLSVNLGGTISFKINTSSSNYSITIYRMGFYQGNGARQIAKISPSATLPQQQPACLTDSTTGLNDCGNWAVSASWSVPANAVSGIYFARLADVATGAASHIVFVVRNDASSSDILFRTNDTTWEAYNDYGGNNLYSATAPASIGRARKVSYNRPFHTRSEPPGDGTSNYVFYGEYPMVRWLEANGYNVSYLTSIDAERSAPLLKNHKLLLMSGHDEYWSAGERSAVQAARDAGVNLAFFTGNEGFWKTRWEYSIDGSNTPYRTLVTYKETLDGKVTDPKDPPTWTGTWRDPRFSPPADGGQPENALGGTMFMVNQGSIAPIVSSSYSKLRLWRNTAVAGLAAGQSLTLGTQTIGYEWDEDLDNGFRPSGLFDLSTTAASVQQLLLDYGATYGAGNAVHHLTMYRAASGALVFAAGTVQWAWGLDTHHDTAPDTGPTSPDPTMQQATVNLFADMGAQPATLQSGLTAATASTDTSAPTSTITTPAANASIVTGTQLTIRGTASDPDGVVAGVEVSVDNGGTWHPALGTSSWSYTITAGAPGSLNIKSRAVDDSGRLETPSAGVAVTISCPCIFGATAPPVADSGDGSAVELGVKFRSDQGGYITGVRFYKSAANVGAHIANLWTSSGTLLASAAFGNETTTGWQVASFNAPVAVTANTTYIASYFAPVGQYAGTQNAFATTGVDKPPLHALANGVDGPNGVYRYGASSGFPTSSFNATNYWVDAIFSAAPVAPAAPGNVDAVAQNASATVSWTPPGNGGSPITAYTITPYLDSAPQVTTTVTGSPPASSATVNGLANGSSYTFTVTASNAAGTSAASMPSNPVTPRAGGSNCSCNIFGADAPTVADAGDGSAVELGLKFRSDVSGSIAGVRFYKSAANAGTHVGNLWSSAGTLLASATFTNETASGWQTASFASPVGISANTTYLVSYFAPVGHYAGTQNSFATSGVDNPPLHALANGVDGPNGVYRYGGSSGFPTSSFNASNYWVDVVFSTGPPPPPPPSTAPGAPASVSASAGNASATVSWTAPSNGGSPITSYSVTPFIGSAAQTPTSVPGSPPPTIATVSGLTNGTTYTFSVTASNAVGTGPASAASNAVTPTAPSCPCNIFGASAPAVADSGDGSAVELGLKFRSDQSGYVSGVRFFRSSTNTGTHVGNLWSSSGTLLASATFTNETASGWQSVSFGSPVAIAANTTYVVSYFAPVGHYAGTQNVFATSGVDSPPLHALANGVDGPNGVYHYGTTSGFPTSSFNASNYWVDVVFTLTAPAATVPGAPSSVSAIAGNASATVNWTAPGNGGGSITSYAVTPFIGSVAQPATIVSGSPPPTTATISGLTNGTSYTFTVSATNGVGPGPASTPSNTVTPSATGFNCPCNIFGASVPPAADSGDGNAVELGLKFRADVNGFVTGVRFYKSTANTGTHVGNLWSSSGTLLASATFTNETASGWQTVSFGSPVAITANTTYIVSYFAAVGHYAGTQNAFAAAGVDRAPLHALANGVDGANGVYRYGSSSGFPASTYNATNYWVDVVFTQ